MAFATAAALGMTPRFALPANGNPTIAAIWPALPFKTSLFMGHDNKLNRPLARRLNLDMECGMPSEHRKRPQERQHQGTITTFRKSPWVSVFSWLLHYTRTHSASYKTPMESG